MEASCKYKDERKTTCQSANGYNTELTCQWHFRGVDAEHLNYLNEKSIVIVIIFGYIWNFIC